MWYIPEYARLIKLKILGGVMEGSERSNQFIGFAFIVLKHIDSYTVPQYGDSPNDEVESWTSEQCVKAIQKYTSRYGSQRRGRIEELRDLVKIAHFAQIAFDKMKPTNDEVLAIEEGRR
jgi:hypothetical protein